MRTGAHIWIGKGLDETIKIIDYLECDCFQIFLHNPRSWERKKRNKEEIVKFKKEIKKRKIFPFVIHMPYLLNLSSSDKKIFKRSVNLLEREIEEAEEYSADYYVVHPGSNPDRKKGVKNLCSVFKNFKSRKIKILVENTSGSGNHLCGNLDEFKYILDKVENTFFCFDTAHAFQYGYKLNSKSGFNEMVEKIEKNSLLDYILLIHANDSLTKQGSKIDRHQHIGKGYIGIKGFELLIRHQYFGNLPYIIETPKETIGQDKRNLKLLRQIGVKYGKI